MKKNYDKTCFKSLTKYVSKKFIRSGIIPYIRENNETIYFFCIDTKYNEITDPGGSVKKNENFLDASLRELEEETLGLFDFRDMKDFIENNSIIVYNRSYCMIFQQCQVEDKLNICKTYLDRYEINKDKEPENSFLIWIKEEDLKKMSMGEKVNMPEELKNVCGIEIYPNIYSKIKCILKKGYSKSDTLF